MNTKTQQQELTELHNEIVILRSFVIGLAGKDSEGEYDPAFVQKVLKASQEELVGTFKNAQTFLAALQ